MEVGEVASESPGEFLDQRRRPLLQPGLDPRLAAAHVTSVETPETDRLGPSSHLAFDQRHQADSVYRATRRLGLGRLPGNRTTDDLAQGRQDVARHRVHIARGRTRYRSRPLDNARHADPATVHRPLLTSKRRRHDTAVRSAVVAAIPQQRVLAQTTLAQPVPELTDRTVHGCDLGVTLLQHFAQWPRDQLPGLVRRHPDGALGVLSWQVLIESQVLAETAVGLVRRPEPDNCTKRLAGIGRPLDELHGLGDQDFGTLARNLLRIRSVSRQHGIQFEKVVVREPCVETHTARVRRRSGLDRPQVPLAKVTRRVTGLLQDRRHADLLGANRAVRGKRTATNRMPPGDHTRSGR